MRAAEAYTRLATKSGQRYSIPSNCAKTGRLYFPDRPDYMDFPKPNRSRFRIDKRRNRHIFLIFVRLEKSKQA